MNKLERGRCYQFDDGVSLEPRGTPPYTVWSPSSSAGGKEFPGHPSHFESLSEAIESVLYMVRRDGDKEKAKRGPAIIEDSKGKTVLCEYNPNDQRLLHTINQLGLVSADEEDSEG